jgi:hypothetical protein
MTAKPFARAHFVLIRTWRVRWRNSHDSSIRFSGLAETRGTSRCCCHSILTPLAKSGTPKDFVAHVSVGRATRTDPAESVLSSAPVRGPQALNLVPQTIDGVF